MTVYLTPFITLYCCALAALIGLAAGSFLNCLAWRLVHGDSVLRGRSKCPSCGHTLGARDLVPLLSWLLLKGRCRYCKKPIPARYPLAELGCAIIYVAIILKYDLSLRALELLLLMSLLLLASLCDFDDMVIPDGIIIAGIALRIPFILLSGDILAAALRSLVGGLSVSLPLLLVVLLAEKLLKKEAMGGGDIKLLFMLGLYFGWQYNLVTLLAACLIGIAFGLAAQKRGKPFPFGPSIALACWLCSLFGGHVIAWYSGLFGL